MFDIHSHILPSIDDGAKDMEESLKLLQMMKADGITHIIATPHFYPQDTGLNEFLSDSKAAYKKLISEIKDKDLPKIYLGCEMLYFDGVGNSTSLKSLCLNNSNFLLLELTDHAINDRLFENITALMKQSGIIPIIAHIERYCKAKNYKKFINFILENKIPIQLNAASFFVPVFKRPLKKLLKSGAFIVIGTDTHSVDTRPPKMTEALMYIEKKYGLEYKIRIMKSSELLFKKIVKGG